MKHFASSVTVVSLLLCLSISSLAATSVSAQIRSTANDYLTGLLAERLTGFDPAKLTISYDPAVDRLSFQRCQQLPTVRPEKGLPLGRRNLQISCPVDQGWSVYVPVRISYLKDVVVIHQDLPNDTILTEQHLTLSERDIGRLHQGYYLDTEALVGQAVRRHLQPGTVVTSNLLRAPQVIEKGDKVVIVASRGNLQVRMMGTALTSGRLGKQIPVRNNKTRRIIKAEVVEAGLVEVPM